MEDYYNIPLYCWKPGNVGSYGAVNFTLSLCVSMALSNGFFPFNRIFGWKTTVLEMEIGCQGCECSSNDYKQTVCPLNKDLKYGQLECVEFESSCVHPGKVHLILL